MIKENKEIMERKSKKNIMTFFISLYMIGLAIAGVSIFIEFQDVISAIASFILILVSIQGLRLFLWLIFGREKITLSNNELLLIKTGSFLLPIIRIPLDKIESFNLTYSYIEQEQGFEGFKGLVTQMSYKMPHLKILNKGRIGIKYDNKQYRILNGLSVQEGKVIIRELNELIKKCR